MGRESLRPLIQMAMPECKKPCKVRRYEFAPMITNEIENDEPSYFYISIVSNEIIVQEEVLMFDSNSIIGTIGGSLGLFIGFSFMSCINYFLDNLQRCRK